MTEKKLYDCGVEDCGYCLMIAVSMLAAVAVLLAAFLYLGQI